MGSSGVYWRLPVSLEGEYLGYRVMFLFDDPLTGERHRGEWRRVTDERLPYLRGYHDACEDKELREEVANLIALLEKHGCIEVCVSMD